MNVLCSLMIFCAVPIAAAQSVTPSFSRHVEAAQDAQARQDCHTAAIEYGLAVQAMPHSGKLRNNQGIAQYCDGQLAAAIVTLRRALVLDPSLVTPHLFLGLASHRLGDEATAAKELEHFSKVNPADQTAHLWLGYTYAAEHKEELATDQFEAVTQVDATNTDAQYSLGQSELALGRQKTRQLETLSPNGAQILKLAGEQYRYQGNSAKSDAAFQQSEDRLKSQSTIDPNVVKKADVLYQEAHDAQLKAQHAFRAILETAPDSFRAHQIIAESFVSMQRQDAAIEEYRRVLELNPALPGIHEAISNCLMHGARFADALTELREEQRLQVDSSRLLTEIGQVQLEMGDETDATSSLRKALTLSAPPPEAFFLLGKALLRQNDAKAAIPMLQKFIAQDAASAPAYYLLARAYRITGDQEAMNKTMTMYRQAAESAKSRSLVRPLTDAPSATALLNPSESADAEKLAASHP